MPSLICRKNHIHLAHCLNQPLILARTYSRLPRYGVPTRYHSPPFSDQVFSMQVSTHFPSTMTSRHSPQWNPSCYHKSATNNPYLSFLLLYPSFPSIIFPYPFPFLYKRHLIPTRYSIQQVRRLSGLCTGFNRHTYKLCISLQSLPGKSRFPLAHPTLSPLV